MEKNKKTKPAEDLIVEEVKDDEIVVEEVKNLEPVKEIKAEIETPQPIPEPKKVGKKTKSAEGTINEILLILFRILLGIFIWLPAFTILLASLVALGISIALVIMSFNYLGLLIIVCGCLMFALAFVTPLTKFVWGREKK